MVSEKAKERSTLLGEFLARQKAKMIKRGWINPPLSEHNRVVAAARQKAMYKFDKAHAARDHFFQTVSQPHFEALQRLKVGKEFFTQEYVLRQMERANWANTDRRLKVFTGRLIQELRRRDIAVYPHSAYRTREEQNELKAKGRSRNAWPRAAHCQGKAVDIVSCRYHWDLTPQEWAIIGVIGKRIAVHYGIPMEWGGDWYNGRKKRGEFDVGWDPAHWQLADWDTPIRRFNQVPKITLTPTKLVRDYPYYLTRPKNHRPKSETVSPHRSDTRAVEQKKDR